VYGIGCYGKCCISENRGSKIILVEILSVCWTGPGFQSVCETDWEKKLTKSNKNFIYCMLLNSLFCWRNICTKVRLSEKREKFFFENMQMDRCQHSHTLKTTDPNRHVPKRSNKMQILSVQRCLCYFMCIFSRSLPHIIRKARCCFSLKATEICIITI
jgi:hypothetical protein